MSTLRLDRKATGFLAGASGLCCGLVLSWAGSRRGPGRHTRKKRGPRSLKTSKKRRGNSARSRS